VFVIYQQCMGISTESFSEIKRLNLISLNMINCILNMQNYGAPLVTHEIILLSRVHDLIISMLHAKCCLIW